MIGFNFQKIKNSLLVTGYGHHETVVKVKLFKIETSLKMKHFWKLMFIFLLVSISSSFHFMFYFQSVSSHVSPSNLVQFHFSICFKSNWLSKSKKKTYLTINKSNPINHNLKQNSLLSQQITINCVEVEII